MDLKRLYVRYTYSHVEEKLNVFLQENSWSLPKIAVSLNVAPTGPPPAPKEGIGDSEAFGLYRCIIFSINRV
jgi:hypothetical protein